MTWIKRHLFWVVIGAVAFVMMAGALYYLFGGVSKNQQVEKSLEEMKAELDKLYRNDPFPADTNITIAKEEMDRIRKTVGQAKGYFKPPEVKTNLNELEFKTLLDNTVAALTTRATNAGIVLPERPYYFSFARQKGILKLNAGCFPGIIEQLSEVQSIAHILFDARIHALTGLKRARLTTDDEGMKDYSDDLRLQTNLVAKSLTSPYEVSFIGFSPDLASVLQGLARSSQGFIVKAIKVDRLEKPPEPPVRAPTPGLKPPPPPRPPTENQTILNEERFLTTMLIAVVKPIP